MALPAVNLCTRCGDQLFPDEILKNDSLCGLCDQIRSEASLILANKQRGVFDHHKNPLILGGLSPNPRNFFNCFKIVT